MQNLKYRAGLARRWSVVVGIGSALFWARQTHASLVINLVFPDGTNVMNVTAANAGQEVPVLVYGTITGSTVTQTPGATSGNFDGLMYTYFDIQSSVGSGGALRGNIDSGATNSSFAPQLNGALNSGFNSFGNQIGAVQDINGDGIADLGSKTDITLMAKPRCNYPAIFNNAPSSVYGGGGNPTGAANIIVSGATHNVVSFLIETVYFKIASSVQNGQSTSLAPLAVDSYLSQIYLPAQYFVNSSQPSAATATQSHDTAAGTSVLFSAVPEPTSGLMFSVLGLSLLRRRPRVGCDKVTE